ncbi:MAG: PAS domain S-box protein [Deltaproteobacteria bacterium]|nr:PAS domain S-box protein [Deltaproteobacteria bacterium]
MEAASPVNNVEQSRKFEETKRRRREAVVIFVTTVILVALIYFEVQLPEVVPEYTLGSNIVFFLVINVTIILLGLLVFLVVRNVVKLVFERRRGILGSRLQSRLVIAFVGLSLVPCVLLFVIAGGLLTRSFDRWFDIKVESALQGSLEISQTYYQNSANNAIFYSRQLSRAISRERLFTADNAAQLKEFIERKQKEYNLGTVTLYSPDGRSFAVAFNERVPTGVTVKPAGDLLTRALRGLDGASTQVFGDADVIRGAAPIYGDEKRIIGAVVVDYFVPKSVSKRASQISQSYENYKYLSFLKTPVKNSYILTLFLMTLVLVLVATWCGIYLSRGIIVPIQKLAEGTHEVAQGNWDYQIESGGDDELGVLMNSFNHMTGDLKQIKLELERRGKAVEMLLANIAAGVVSVDTAGKITTWNKAAEKVLGVAALDAMGKHYQEVFRAEGLGTIREIVETIENVSGPRSIEREIKIPSAQQVLTAVVSAATLRDDAELTLGIMIFLEDITEIKKVQRMEAWREVAQRIAHEIKNPLTPIQLSAERLRKRYSELLKEDGAILDKCTTTIIQQVDELKNLVNEFSQFARLPSAQLLSNDLNEVVNEALFLFKEGHNGIDFEFRGGVIPPVEIDREQIKRVLINLLDNAVAAVQGGGAIKLATVYDPRRAVVTLDVADDGCGLAPDSRAKIFEPYFSTKHNGTGLGLTIVSQIIEDHRGYIRALPNQPRGTRFTIELPAANGAGPLDSAKKVLHS